MDKRIFLNWVDKCVPMRRNERVKLNGLVTSRHNNKICIWYYSEKREGVGLSSNMPQMDWELKNNVLEFHPPSSVNFVIWNERKKRENKICSSLVVS